MWCLASCFSDEEKYIELSKRLAETVGGLPKGYDFRKVFLFLLLNSDTDAIDLVAEDENFCHLIGTVPPINFLLTLRLIFKLGGLRFLLGLIAYGPSVLSMSVIDTILKADELSPQTLSDPELILNLSKACFYKLTLNTGESVVILEKFHNYLLSLQKYGYSSFPNDKPYSCMNVDWKKGLYYIHNVQLFEFTLEKNVTLDQSECWEGYLMHCNSKESDELSKVKPRTLDDLVWEYRSVIMTNLNKLVRELTVDNWMGMAEVTYKADKTLQRTLGEKTYQFVELLENISNDPRLADLPAYLEAAMPFAMKPEDEVEKTEDLSIEEIKSKLTCAVSRSSKCMKIFLKSEDVLKDDGTLAIIQDNCDLLDKSDVEFILFSSVQILKEGDIDSSKVERLKSLSYESMKNLNLEEILEVKQNFCETFGVVSYLSDSQFTSNLQDAFNKLSFEPENISEEVRLICQYYLKTF